MKIFKKFTGMLLMVIMILSMSMVAFAAKGTNDNNGIITINDAEAGHDYNVYQILKLESYDTEAGLYAYKADPSWESWLKAQTQYVSVAAQGYVTWVQDADPAAFAKAALAHAAENNIQPVETKTADSTTVQFTGLNLGYYLIDTTVGTLCSLDTTTPSVTMEEKNELPPVKKEVQEDSDQSWGDKNTAAIGDTVNFRTTITAKKGAQSYVLHDVMSDGLTLNANSIKVQVGGKELAVENYTITTTELTDGCTFEISFDQSYLDTITADTDIVVTYSAVLNENAVISPEAETNKTQLKFGEDSRDETTWDETKTYTFKVDVVKTDSDNKVLDGAQFKLYDAKTGGNEIPVVKVGDGVYRLAKDNETGVVIETKGGQAEIRGLDANTTYWMEETKAPEGYNKLAERVEIAVKEANIETTIDSDIWEEGDGGVHIVNKAGNLLPHTGGMGTTIFYVIGGVLVIAAGAMLIIRRRIRK